MATLLTGIISFSFQPITDDDVDRIALCLRVLSERSPMMYEIFNKQCRQSLSIMLLAKAEEEKEFLKVCQFDRHEIVRKREITVSYDFIILSVVY